MSERQRRDRGNVSVMFFFGAMLTVALIMAIAATGQKLIQRETLQDSADAAALAGAVVRAKALNFIAFCNLVDAALAAVFVILKGVAFGLQIFLPIASSMCSSHHYDYCAYIPHAVEVLKRYPDRGRAHAGDDVDAGAKRAHRRADRAGDGAGRGLQSRHRRRVPAQLRQRPLGADHPRRRRGTPRQRRQFRRVVAEGAGPVRPHPRLRDAVSPQHARLLRPRQQGVRPRLRRRRRHEQPGHAARRRAAARARRRLARPPLLPHHVVARRHRRRLAAQIVGVAAQKKSTDGRNSTVGSAQAEFFAFNGHEDLWHVDWRARLSLSTPFVPVPDELRQFWVH